MCFLKTGCHDNARINQQFAIESNLVYFREENYSFICVCFGFFWNGCGQIRLEFKGCCQMRGWA